MPPFRVWFFDRPLINRVSNSKISKKFFKQGPKSSHFDEKMSGIWPENHKQGINFSRFAWTFYHKQGQDFKVWAAPPYPNLGRVPPGHFTQHFNFQGFVKVSSSLCDSYQNHFETHLKISRCNKGFKLLFAYIPVNHPDLIYEDSLSKPLKIRTSRFSRISASKFSCFKIIFK